MYLISLIIKKNTYKVPGNFFRFRVCTAVDASLHNDNKVKRVSPNSPKFSSPNAPHNFKNRMGVALYRDPSC